MKTSIESHTPDDGSDCYTINPLGHMPVPEPGSSQRLTENAVILQCIADQPRKKSFTSQRQPETLSAAKSFEPYRQ